MVSDNRHRVYWRKIVVGVVGLVLATSLTFLAYELYKSSEQQNSDYSYQPADEASVIVTGVSKASIEAYQPKCKKPQTDEDADLCAQWAAVEQVSEANRLTSLNAKMAIASLIATAIATFLLLWTLHETRNTARRQLRAYLQTGQSRLRFVKVPPLQGRFGDGGGKVDQPIEIEIIIENTGQTPAYSVVFNYFIYIWSATGVFQKEQALGGRVPIAELGRTHKINHRLAISGGIWNQQIGPGVGVIVTGNIEYTDAFDRIWTYDTGLCYHPTVKVGVTPLRENPSVYGPIVVDEWLEMDNVGGGGNYE